MGVCVERFLVVEGETKEGSELIASAHPYAVACVCVGEVCDVVGKGHHTDWGVTLRGVNGVGIRGSIDPLEEWVQEQCPFKGSQGASLAKATGEGNGAPFPMPCNNRAETAYIKVHEKIN
jgi:hypothetical protein